MINFFENVLSYIVPAIFIFILKDIFDLFLISKNIRRFNATAIWIIYLFLDHTIRSRTSFNTVESMVYNTACFIILCKLLYTDSLKRLLIIVLFVISLGCIAELITGFLFIICWGSVEEYELFGSVCSKLMLLIMSRIAKLFSFYKYNNIFSYKNWLASICLTIGSLFIIDSLYLLNKNEQNHSQLGRAMFSAIIILLLNVIAFKVFDLLVVYSVKQQENMVYKQQIAFFEMQNVEREDVIKEMRKYRHDFKNHITCIRELIDKEEYGRAINYIESISRIAIVNELPFNGSGNILVDALIKSKYTLADKYKITVVPTLEIPSKLPFSDCDICVIIGNSLDNAIEALKDSSIVPKKIFIEIRMRHSNLIICVKNKYEARLKRDRIGNIITRKMDTYNHGLGLSSVKTAVEKYNGIMDINTDNKIFEVSILLYSSGK